MTTTGSIQSPPPGHLPVALLLSVDAAYRGKAESGELRKIAPRRFNPNDEAWLPIMHEARKVALHGALFEHGKGGDARGIEDEPGPPGFARSQARGLLRRDAKRRGG